MIARHEDEAISVARQQPLCKSLQEMHGLLMLVG